MTTTRRTLIVAEDFYADPLGVRQYALSQQYYHPYQPDARIEQGEAPRWLSTWFKSSAECPFKASRRLVERLQALTGDVIDMDHWNASFPITEEGKASPDCENHERSCLWNCCFHVKPQTEQQRGEGVHNHVTDIWNSVGADGWAGLIYLSPDAPVSRGLMLWRNRDRERDYDWMTPPANWELVDELGNVFNRLVLARGSLPHSGGTGWGHGIEDGRLFQTFFFRVMPSPPLTPMPTPLAGDTVE